MKKNASTLCAVLALEAALLFLSPAQARGQGNEVVKSEILMSKSAVHAGETVKAGLRLKIIPGWHINAHQTTDEFMLPSEFAVEDAAPFKIAEIFYPDPRKGKFEYSETELLIYEGEETLGALIETAPNAAPGIYKLKGTFTFQACDSRSCIQPKTIHLEIDIQVVPASQQVQDLNQDVFSRMTFKKDKEAGKK